MYSRLETASLYGLEAEQTTVEVDSENGLPNFVIVGLANQAVKEAKERIHSAILNCGCRFPVSRITVNLTPANKKKEGSHYDLAIALGVLLASRQLPALEGTLLEKAVFLGELNLDGRVTSIEGALPMIISMQKRGVELVVLPRANLAEAELVKGMKLAPVESLMELIEYLRDGKPLKILDAAGYIPADGCRISMPDFSDVKGQEAVKRAAQIAAAGFHGMLMIGAPGVGKSMIAKRIPGIMPPLSYGEQLEVTQVYSAAGLLGGRLAWSSDTGTGLVTDRPFRSPHHSISSAALVGGGPKPRPGEISLAHFGVLFLDELPEFSSRTLEVLRQPMEDGMVNINRVAGAVSYPSRFMLVAAMNPCKCGYYGDPVRQCTCTETQRRQYISRISGPLLDRIDLHIAMERIAYKDLEKEALERMRCTGTEELRMAVIEAYRIQQERYEGLDISSNSQLTPAHIAKFCALDKSGRDIMEAAYASMDLSARAYHKVLKLARTIADISGSPNIQDAQLLEALSYRLPEQYFK